MGGAAPKVLHHLAGREMLHHVLVKAQKISSNIVVVIGYKADEVKSSCENFKVSFAHQQEQLGTGHAALCALNSLNPCEKVLVLSGDVPNISLSLLQKIDTGVSANCLGLITTKLDNPDGYGRVVRNKEHKINKIVEHKDATANELRVDEINTGIYSFPYDFLQKNLPEIDNKNKAGEFYLTDLIEVALKSGIAIEGVNAEVAADVLGVNTLEQLVVLERHFQRQQAWALVAKGVKVADPDRLDIRGEVITGKNISLDVNVILEGRVILEDDVSIGANVIIKNSTIKKGSVVAPFSHIDGSFVGNESSIGPYARLRPGSKLHSKVRVGNFVEVKASTLGRGTKACHLSYIGDAEIGNGVNIGAGTITCNYNGFLKQKTKIADNVFVGSNTELIAPINIAEGVTIAAGTTVTKSVEANSLLLNPKEQKVISSWSLKPNIKSLVKEREKN